MPDVTPHTLRHTAATWLMQRRADLLEAAGFLGMSVEQFERTYGHHHSDHLKSARDALDSRPEVASEQIATAPVSPPKQRNRT
jgi:integrase